MTSWTSRHYAIFRFILGSYLFMHFAALIPWSRDLFSNEGMLQAHHSPLLGLFPNPLGWFTSPAFALFFVAAGAIFALLLAAGKHDRIAALGAWFVWACLLGRNPLISNPGIPFVGWLLWMHAALPGERTPEWRFPASFHGLSWMVMELGYTFSGLTKLSSPSWADGSALWHVLSSPLAHATPLREALLAHPTLLQGMSFGVLGLELASVFLIPFKRLRPLLWCALVAMHLGILLTVDFADLTLGMLMIHVITFDPAWLSRTHRQDDARPQQHP